MVKSPLINLITKILFVAVSAAFVGFVVLNWSVLILQSNTIYHNAVPSRIFATTPQLSSQIGTQALKDSDVTFMYRGNVLRQGYSSEILENYQKLKVNWISDDLNSSVHRASKATPAVDKSGIYVGGDDGWFYAFDHHGQVKWKYFTTLTDNGIHGTAILVKDRVCFGSYNGNFYCLNKETGQPIWILKLADAMGSSPLFYEGDFFVSIETSSVNGYVARLNGTTGEIKWQSPWVGEQIHSSVTLDPEHRRVFVGANNGRIIAFHMDTGGLLWSRSATGEMKGTALIADGKIVFSSWGKEFAAVDLNTLKDVWSVKLEGPSQSSPTLVPGKNLVGINYHGEHPAFHVYDLGTGQLKWSHKLTSPKVMNLQSALAVQVSPGEWAFLQMCDMHQLCLLKATDGKVLRRWEVPGFMTGTPVVFENRIYINMEYGGLVRIAAD